MSPKTSKRVLCNFSSFFFVYENTVSVFPSSVVELFYAVIWDVNWVETWWCDFDSLVLSWHEIRRSCCKIYSKCHSVCQRVNEAGRQRFSEIEDLHWHILFQTSSFNDKKIRDTTRGNHSWTEDCCSVTSTHSSLAAPSGDGRYCKNWERYPLHDERWMNRKKIQ